MAAKKKSRLRPSSPSEPLRKRNPAQGRIPRSASGQPKRAGSNSFPIVGIGASAGGLEAFTALLHSLPAETGMGFVVVQHLAPTQDGMLPALLAKTTRMPVREVAEGMKVEPNSIYVIPPNKSMAISHGVLRLLPRSVTQGQVRSIDFFFSALAADRGNEAIGVILSGTASDGTLGLEAIKAEGGITFAQDESAKFDSMPRSAVAAGCVDFVLGPAEIAGELARLAAHPYVRQPRGGATDEVTDSEPADDFKKILALLRRSTGTDFTAYKPATLHRRLHRRMVLGKYKNLADYVSFLETHPAELAALGGDFLIGVTNFFRDPAAFTLLKRKTFPHLVKLHGARPVDEALRVWVLGCSTGQEAYSIAMAWLEFADSARTNLSLQIFSTDVHSPYLDRARSAVYSRSLLQDVSPERLRRFFVEADGGYRVNKAVRDMCVFARQNVLTDPPFSHLDLISCRNMLIYIRPELQKKIIPIFHFALRPGGVLLLGPAETVSGFSDLFVPLDSKFKFFQRTPGAAKVETRFGAQARHPAAAASAEPLRAAAFVPPRGLDAQREADRLMLAHHGPVGVLINAELEVLQFRGSTGQYLEASSGKASLNLLKMAREGLFSPLRRAIRKAIADNVPVKTPGVIIKQPGHTHTVTVEVFPLKHRPGEQRCLLVNFVPAEQAPSGGAKSGAPIAIAKTREQDGPIPGGRAHLQTELAETKEHLQGVIEQQDAYNEELQSANEEAQAANEELQSINEEMETAKEELQATNEELTTLNEELQTRNEQLALTSNDLSNLMTSANIPAVMLTRDLRVRRFTPLAEKVLNILATDVGRPITDLTLNISISDLRTTLVRVIDTVDTHEQEVRDPAGRWFALRIHPYITAENKIDGAVLVFVDIDSLKRTQGQIVEARDYAANIVETVGEPLLVLDQALIVQTANRAFYDLFRVAPQETEHRSIYALGSGHWNIPGLRTMLEKILPQNEQIHDYEVEIDFPRIGSKILRLNARRIVQVTTGRPLILLALADVTDQRKAEERNRESAQRFRFMAESMPQKISTSRPDGEADYFNRQWLEFTGITSEELRESGWKPFIHPEDVKQTERLWRSSVATGKAFELEHRFRRKDGVFRWHLSRARATRDAEGKILMWIGSSTDIDEQKRAEEKLEKAVADRTSELKRIIGELETFSYTMAHDLRGPLRTMQGYANILRDDYGGKLDESGLRFVRQIASAADRMHKLVTDVLAFTRLTRDPLPMEPVALRPMIATIIEQYPTLKGAGIRIVDEPSPVLANPATLAQAISNLLTNAVKFVPPGRAPEIEVHTEQDDGWVTLFVRDNGIGVPTQDQERIFRMFERAHGSEHFEGTGIGLAIVRQTVERMGGSVGVKSKPGEGSTFWLKLQRPDAA